MAVLSVGQKLTDPCEELPGRWSVWSQCGWGPGHYFLLPQDGQPVKHAVIRVTQKRNATTPEIKFVQEVK